VSTTTEDEMSSDEVRAALAAYEHVLGLRTRVEGDLIDEGKAALEADFVGVHIGEFAGIAATQNSVRVPYSVIYDLDGDRIKALRIYMPLQDLLAQLGAPVVSAQAGAQA
jgi:predicted ester cyclase